MRLPRVVFQSDLDRTDCPPSLATQLEYYHSTLKRVVSDSVALLTSAAGGVVL